MVEPIALRFVFVRHGESEANVSGEFSTRGWKHGLTERGRAGVVALAQDLDSRFSGKPQPVVALFASPLRRAVETAEILSARLGVPFTVTDALREVDVGDLEGRRDEAAWQENRELYRRWFEGKEWNYRLPGGESYCDLERRFVPFFESVVAQHRETGGDIFFVAHGGIYITMLPRVLSNVTPRLVLSRLFPHETRVEAELREGKPVCTWWGDSQNGQLESVASAYG